MAWLKNNYQFEFTDTLTTSWMSVRISNEKENNAVATFTNQYITVRREDNSIVERMKGSAAAWTLTLTMRWLDQSDTDTQDAWLKKERREWSKAFVTYVASQHVDPRDDNTFSGTQTFTNIVVSQDVTVWDDLTVAWDTTLNGKYKWPSVADVAARNAMYPSPVDGNMVQVETIWLQYYKASAGWWITLDEWTPTPDATEVIKGKATITTTPEAIAGIVDDEIMTPKKTKDALDNYAISEQLTAWEAMSANDWYRRGNTALNTTTVSQNNWWLSVWTFLRIGYDNTETKAWVQFTTATGKFLQTIEVKNWKSWTPTGNNTCIVRTSASGGGTIVATSTNTFAESTYSTAQGTGTVCVYTFNNTFIWPWTYYVEQTTDRANSTSNYVGWCFTASASSPSYHISNTWVWTWTSPDCYFVATLLEQNEVTTKFYKALNTTNRSTILWLVKSSVAADATFTALKKGYDKWFTWLTAWNPVFLQADWSITHTITNKKVWEATASDTILIDIDKHTESMVITRDVSLATGVVTYNHTLWEKFVYATANWLFAVSWSWVYSTSNGTYNWSTQICNVAFYNSWIATNANLITAWTATTAYQTWFIQNITNNTFDINWTKVGTPTGTATIFLILSL